jgi:hypothetical protein
MADLQVSETAERNGLLVPSWVAAVRNTAERLKAELDRTSDHGQVAAYDKNKEVVQAALNRAVDNANRPSLKGTGLAWFFRSFRRIADWWTGYYDDRAWANVHVAGNVLLGIEDSAVVKAQLADMAATVMTALEPDDLRVKDYLKTLELLAPPCRQITAEDREQLRGIRQACDSSADSGHADARAFRNNLILAAGALATVLIIVAVVASVDPHFRTVFEPSTPQGGWFVLELELVASLSGLTGAVLSLRNYTGFQYSYGLSFVQAILKGSTGAATGLLGVLLVKPGVVTSLPLHSAAAIFAAAIVFGYAQYLFTRLVDQEAKTVLKSAGSRSDTSNPAQPARGAAAPALLTTDPAPCPRVTATHPKSGSAHGGTTVTVTGSGFAAASAVRFGGRIAVDVTIDSDTQITVQSPPGNGIVGITVAAPVGESAPSAAAQFSYARSRYGP